MVIHTRKKKQGGGELEKGFEEGEATLKTDQENNL